jgi:hypothetical protein
MAGVGVSAALALSGCNGLVDDAAAALTRDAGALHDAGVPVGAGAPQDAGADEATGGDVYGAGYQGDGGACATVLCSGAQVCCVIPVPSDASTPYPNNKCDYDCVAVCMDSCPAVSADGVDAAPSLAEGMHGGALREPASDAALE